MPNSSDYKLNLEIIQKINNLRSEIASITESLEYADGQTYRTETRKRRALQSELMETKARYDIITGKTKPRAELTNREVDEQRARINKQKEVVAAEIKAENAELVRRLVEEKKPKVKKAPVKICNARRFYIKECGYATGQMLKKNHEDLRWDPAVQRWYFSVWMHGGTTYDPGSPGKLWMLPLDKSNLAYEWSRNILDELENKPEHERFYTFKVHNTYTPKFWNK